MAHSGMVLTNSGKILQAKVQAGTELQFTKIMLGDGVLQQGANLETLTTLISPKMTVNISSVQAPGDGTCKISSTYTNTGLTTGFKIREIGVFAIDPDAGEILYSIDNAGEEYAYLPAGSGLAVYENNLDIIAVVGNASSVTAIIDEGKVFATKKEMSEHKADADTHTPAFDKHNDDVNAHSPAMAKHNNQPDAHVLAFAQHDLKTDAHTGGIKGNAATATKLQTARSIGLSGKVTGTATNFDGSGNISIPVTDVTADSCTGNAVTATRLQTTRSIGLSGKVTGTATNFDGSGNISIPVTAVTADSCAGNSATATKLQTTRSIGLSGKVTGTATNFDGSGNISIPITAVTADSCVGNATTATKLQTARSIALSGAATGTATSFDGSNNITIPVTSLDASKLTGTAPVNTTGNAATATKLQTARTVSLSGKVTGMATSFDGSNNITIPITAVTADSCTGNSATATKATQDSDGNQINNTYTKKSTFASDVISALASKTLSSLGVAYSMGSTGYVAFGDLFGGLIIQWGGSSVPADYISQIRLPVRFSDNLNYQILITPSIGSTDTIYNRVCSTMFDTKTASSISIRTTHVVSPSVYYIAVGF